MALTHEELLAKIKTPNEFLGVKYAPDWQHVALRAVVELHKPDDAGFCSDCFGTPYVTYPCSTIRAIEKELQ